MKTDQPSLGRRGTLFLLVVLAAFPPITMDLYLPALPQIVEAFGTSHATVNLTLGAYMAAYACGILFWGPLSEKMGRKPILLIGIAVYILAGVGCAVAFDIDSLIAFRILQGFGGGGVTVTGTAIVKDLYDGREREKIMATIMSLVVVAPMVAPVLGALLLKVGSWRMLFITLVLFGGFAAALVVFLRETLQERYSGPILRSWTRLGVVLKNRRFVYLLAVFGLAPMCLMAFIGSAAYVYIDGFGLSEQSFSLIFAFNAAFTMIGPALYICVSRLVPVQTVILGCFATLVLGGTAIVLVGEVSPLVFAGLAAVSTTAVIVLRVPGANLMLEQQERDTGSAAALIHFVTMMLGALGVQLVAAHAQDLVRNLGTLFVVVGTVCAVLWLIVRHRPFVADKVAQVP